MLPTIIQATGIAVIAVGLALIYVPAGLICVGVGVLLFGLGVDGSFSGDTTAIVAIVTGKQIGRAHV